MSRIVTLLKLLVTILIFIYLYGKIDLDNFSSLAQKVAIPYILLAIIILLIQMVFSALRWKMLAENFDQYITLDNAIRLIFFGQMVNQLIPGGVSGDVLRGIQVTKNTATSNKRSLVIILCDRLLGMYFILVYVAIIFLAYKFIFGSNDLMFYSSPIFEISVLVVLFSFLILIGAAKFPIILSFGEFYSNVMKVINSLPKHFLYTCIIQILISLACISIAYSLNVYLNILELMFVFPLALLITAIPLSIGGWGFRELSFIFVLKQMAVNTDTAVAISVIYGLIQLLISLPGLMFFTASYEKN